MNQTNKQTEQELKKCICPCCKEETITEDKDGYGCFNCEAEFNKPKKRITWREWIK